MKSTLLLGALCTLLATPIWAQENTDLPTQIRKKEAELKAAAVSSRSIHQSLTAELNELYRAWKEQLENEIPELSDTQEKNRKEAELLEVKQKLEKNNPTKQR